MRIPLEMVGTFCSFASRVPTQDELDSLPHISLTDTTPWDPSHASFTLHETEEEEDTEGGQVASVMSKYNEAQRVAAIQFSALDRLLRLILSVFTDWFYE